VYCLNTSTGALLWRYATGDRVVSTGALADGRLFIGSEDSRVYGLNAFSGAQLWNFTTGGFVLGSPAVAFGNVFVGSLDSYVYCLNASTGTQKWSYQTGDFVESSPAVTDEYLFVGSYDGHVYCLRTADGQHVFNFTTPGGSVTASPAIADGIVYVGSTNGHLYAFGAAASHYAVEYGGQSFDVDIVSNSMLSAFTFDQAMKTLSFNVTGDPGTRGVCAVTFPVTLLAGPYACRLNDTFITPEDNSNATHTALAFLYDHSTHTLEIIGTTVIPEFPTPLTMGFLLLILTAATGLVKRLR
jgi:outer membrane protein assembly factor BamB